jgi:cyanate permease
VQQNFKSAWWVVFGSVLGLTVGNVTVLQFSTSVLMKPIIEESGWNRGMMSVAFVAVLACATWLILRLPRRYPYPVQSPAQARAAEDSPPYEPRIIRSLGNS